LAGRCKPNESRHCKRLRRRWTGFGSRVRVAWLLVEIGDAGNAIRPAELPTRKACGFRSAGVQNGAAGLHSSPIASDFDVRRGSDPRLDGHLQWLEKMCGQVRGRPVDAARSRNQGITLGRRVQTRPGRGGGCSSDRTGLSIQIPCYYNREFCRFRPSVAISTSSQPVNSMASSRIPYATEQGIFKRVSGKIFSRNREFSREILRFAFWSSHSPMRTAFSGL